MKEDISVVFLFIFNKADKKHVKIFFTLFCRRLPVQLIGLSEKTVLILL